MCLLCIYVCIYTIQIINVFSEKRKEFVKEGTSCNKLRLWNLVSYIEKHLEVALGKFTSTNVHDDLDKQWQELATDLNSLVPQEKAKDVKSWKTKYLYK